MRLVLLSDTHQKQGQVQVPEGDVLVHAGDFCNRGTLLEVELFARWLHGLPHQNKVVIAGNHDWPFERTGEAARQLLQAAGCHYLEDSRVEIEGLLFYGSPWQPCFYDWAFNLPRKGPELERVWSQIPSTTNVLVTHGPPFGHGDVVRRGERVGCERLAEAVQRLPALRLHVFGHIHEGYGVNVAAPGAPLFANASICDERYRPVNPPLVIDL